jgi:hypothetical protein
MAKSISRAVGLGEPNLPDDVRVIQYLLNCVPVAHGGPQKELVVNGQAESATIEAIRRFQWTRAKIAGARIAPHDPLLESLHDYDPFPSVESAVWLLGSKYTMFSRDGIPVRATAGVKQSAKHPGSGSLKKTA